MQIFTVVLTSTTFNQQKARFSENISPDHRFF